MTGATESSVICGSRSGLGVRCLRADMQYRYVDSHQGIGIAPSTMGSITTIGRWVGLIGIFVFPGAADLYGRKPILIVAILGYSLFSGVYWFCHWLDQLFRVFDLVQSCCAVRRVAVRQHGRRRPRQCEPNGASVPRAFSTADFRSVIRRVRGGLLRRATMGPAHASLSRRCPGTAGVVDRFGVRESRGSNMCPPPWCATG